jgi:hypothetical protein
MYLCLVLVVCQPTYLNLCILIWRLHLTFVLFPYVLITLICFATDLPTCKRHFHILAFSLSHSYTKTSVVREGCILGPLLFNVCINAVCDSDCTCNCVLFTDDVRTINDVEDCKFLQFDIDVF